MSGRTVDLLSVGGAALWPVAMIAFGPFFERDLTFLAFGLGTYLIVLGFLVILGLVTRSGE